MVLATVATICARGGSQGLPGKNIRPLAGKPLIAHSIEQALACPRIDAVYVSTDDPEIAEIARLYGAEVPFLRPAELATASAPKLPVVRHLVEAIEAAGVAVGRIVDLQPTSPLRDRTDIDACLDLLDADTDCVITGCIAHANPYFNMVELDEGGHARLSKPLAGDIAGRQMAPPVYAMNGSVYAWHRATLDKGLWGGRTRLHAMPPERSVDIDTAIDFQLAELLIREADVHG
jgi:CMP-N,N'-diacetyllegionaminic acid synthase